MTGDYPHPCPSCSATRRRAWWRSRAGVDTVKPGDHVCSSYIPSCGRCAYCIGGQPTMCALRDKPRWFMHDGTSRLRKNGLALHHFLQVAGYATHAVLPEQSVIPIRKDAPLDVACLVSCGVLAGAGPVFNRAKVVPGASVAVWGCGGVGLNTIHAAKMVCGQDHRVYVVRQNCRGLRVGATHVVDASEMRSVAACRAQRHGRVDFSSGVVTQPTVGACLLANTAAYLRLVGRVPAGTRLPSTHALPGSSACHGTSARRTPAHDLRCYRPLHALNYKLTNDHRACRSRSQRASTSWCGRVKRSSSFTSGSIACASVADCIVASLRPRLRSMRRPASHPLAGRAARPPATQGHQRRATRPTRPRGRERRSHAYITLDRAGALAAASGRCRLPRQVKGRLHGVRGLKETSCRLPTRQNACAPRVRAEATAPVVQKCDAGP